jgi:hypothetical protein
VTVVMLRLPNVHVMRSLARGANDVWSTIGIDPCCPHQRSIACQLNHLESFRIVAHRSPLHLSSTAHRETGHDPRRRSDMHAIDCGVTVVGSRVPISLNVAPCAFTLGRRSLHNFSTPCASKRASRHPCGELVTSSCHATMGTVGTQGDWDSCP